MKTILKQWFAGLTAVTFIAVAVSAQDAQNLRRGTIRESLTDKNIHDRIPNPHTTNPHTGSAQKAQDDTPNRSADRENLTDAEVYDRIANSRTTIGDEVDQQQWYNPADWWDHNPTYNYMTDEFYNERTGQVGYHDYLSRSWNYPGSAWEDNDYWDDDWNNDLEIGDWEGDLDWNDDEWWE